MQPYKANSSTNTSIMVSPISIHPFRSSGMRRGKPPHAPLVSRRRARFNRTASCPGALYVARREMRSLLLPSQPFPRVFYPMPKGKSGAKIQGNYLKNGGIAKQEFCNPSVLCMSVPFPKRRDGPRRLDRKRPEQRGKWNFSAIYRFSCFSYPLLPPSTPILSPFLRSRAVPPEAVVGTKRGADGDKREAAHG